jgi:hypothetical protein
MMATSVLVGLLSTCQRTPEVRRWLTTCTRVRNSDCNTATTSTFPQRPACNHPAPVYLPNNLQKPMSRESGGDMPCAALEESLLPGLNRYWPYARIERS